jgi:hypothetical protein
MNERLRQKKIARIKKRRKKARQRDLLPEDKFVRLKKFFAAGSRHGARKVKVTRYKRVIQAPVMSLSLWAKMIEFFEDYGKKVFTRGKKREWKDRAKYVQTKEPGKSIIVCRRQKKI